MNVRPNFSLAARLTVVGALGAGLAACQQSGSMYNARAWKPIPAETIALMQSKDTDAHQPILIRAYKKEAELEIWKKKHDGKYALLKTYPMCRWSGQLGPKKREGDRQVPEGFYSISPGQMNPNSNYYLSFNVGYPNAYDRALGRTGGKIMVHGDCSSAGCFSMTDNQISEIYAIAREAFGGGQREIQMQSFPFRMTAENLAKHRLDPNMPFWRQLKQGSDYFEVAKTEPKVGVCNHRYVFDAKPANGGALNPAVACPPLTVDPQLKMLVAQKEAHDDARVAALVSKGIRPIRMLYADGGQNPKFANVEMVSRPAALAVAPVEIPMDTQKGRTAAAKLIAARRGKSIDAQIAATAALEKKETVAVREQAPAPQPTVALAAVTPSPTDTIGRWLGINKSKPKPTPAARPAKTPETILVTDPDKPAKSARTHKPRRASNGSKLKPQASLGSPRLFLPDGRPTLASSVLGYAETR
ncbi:MAG: murein L,D-transpeptidase [Methylobacteriaceae bacterium]|nr:murein L,D-transpeptidase [Methylobacteriaceae bacterium]